MKVYEPYFTVTHFKPSLTTHSSTQNCGLKRFGSSVVQQRCFNDPRSSQVPILNFCPLPWAELHKKLVRLRPHQFVKISNVTARRLQFSQVMYCVKYLKASPEFKS